MGTTDGGNGGVVPLHLVDLYNQATEDRTEQEQEDIANLLTKFSSAFSKHESDLGWTNLTEYTIGTGDSKPITLRSTRVPMTFAGEEKKLFLRCMNKASYRNLTHLGPVRLY